MIEPRERRPVRPPPHSYRGGLPHGWGSSSPDGLLPGARDDVAAVAAALPGRRAGVGARVDAELAQDVLDMRADGRCREPETLRHLGGRRVLGEEVEHFRLA